VIVVVALVLTLITAVRFALDVRAERQKNNHQMESSSG